MLIHDYEQQWIFELAREAVVDAGADPENEALMAIVKEYFRAIALLDDMAKTEYPSPENKDAARRIVEASKAFKR